MYNDSRVFSSFVLNKSKKTHMLRFSLNIGALTMVIEIMSFSLSNSLGCFLILDKREVDLKMHKCDLTCIM